MPLLALESIRVTPSALLLPASPFGDVKSRTVVRTDLLLRVPELPRKGLRRGQNADRDLSAPCIPLWDVKFCSGVISRELQKRTNRVSRTRCRPHILHVLLPDPERIESAKIDRVVVGSINHPTNLVRLRCLGGSYNEAVSDTL